MYAIQRIVVCQFISAILIIPSTTTLERNNDINIYSPLLWIFLKTTRTYGSQPAANRTARFDDSRRCIRLFVVIAAFRKLPGRRRAATLGFTPRLAATDCLAAHRRTCWFTREIRHASIQGLERGTASSSPEWLHARLFARITCVYIYIYLRASIYLTERAVLHPSLCTPVRHVELHYLVNYARQNQDGFARVCVLLLGNRQMKRRDCRSIEPELLQHFEVL